MHSYTDHQRPFARFVVCVSIYGGWLGLHLLFRVGLCDFVSATNMRVVYHTAVCAHHFPRASSSST